MTADGRCAPATHEAGHAVVGVAFGLELVSLDIRATEGRLGAAEFVPVGFGFAEPEIQDAYAAMTWAGTLAQERAGFGDGGAGFGRTGDDFGAEPDSNLGELLVMASKVGEVGEESAELARWQALAEATLARHWDAVERVAREADPGGARGPSAGRCSSGGRGLGAATLTEPAPSWAGGCRVSDRSVRGRLSRTEGPSDQAGVAIGPRVGQAQDLVDRTVRRVLADAAVG